MAPHNRWIVTVFALWLLYQAWVMFPNGAPFGNILAGSVWVGLCCWINTKFHQR